MAENGQGIKFLKSKPTEWPAWMWLIILLVFPNLISLMGANDLRIRDIFSGKDQTEISRSVAISLVESNSKTIDAVNTLTTDHKVHKALSDERIQKIEDQLKEIKAELKHIMEKIK